MVKTYFLLAPRARHDQEDQEVRDWKARITILIESNLLTSDRCCVETCGLCSSETVMEYAATRKDLGQATEYDCRKFPSKAAPHCPWTMHPIESLET